MMTHDALLYLHDHLVGVGSIQAVTPPVHHLEDTVRINADSSIMLLSEINTYSQIVCRAYVILASDLPPEKSRRNCVYTEFLKLNADNGNFLDFGIRDEHIFAFHRIKSDQPREGILDDYYRTRIALQHFVRELPVIIEKVVEACSEE
jgi:hypothetical protein